MKNERQTMELNRSVYKKWAAEDSVWSAWVKPVIFCAAPRSLDAAPSVPSISWAQFADSKTAFVVDLPGNESALTGLGLAALGYRPIPLYNGVFAPSKKSMVVDVTEIVGTLYGGAELLETMPLRPSSPPAFLLDSSRMEGGALKSGKYDNRWCVFAQDMPSADFLLKQGIEQIYLRTDRFENDLAHILEAYQKRGIKIYHVNNLGHTLLLDRVRPSEIRGLAYRFHAITRLKRNAAGGFGGKIPEATQASSSGYSGGRYYGIG